MLINTKRREVTSWREGGFKCNVPYSGPLGTQEEEGEGAQTTVGSVGRY